MTIKGVLIILFSLIFLFSCLIFYIDFSDYSPDEIIILPINNNQVKTLTTDELLKIITLNIGYGGLDKDQDLYIDGGIRSSAKSKNKVVENLDGIVGIVDEINPDFLLLQELEIDSSRSFRVDQVSYLNDKYPNYSFIHGKNYDVDWVPYPIFRPTGRVESGIGTFSKYNAIDAYRYGLPGQEDGFHKYFEFDRCFTQKRFKVENGKELLIINLHLSDFDNTGLHRQLELRYLKDHIEKEEYKDSYIIVGGDWNHNLPGTDPYTFKSEEEWPSWLKNLPEEFQLEGFTWAIDATTPTVRTLAKDYLDGVNFLAVTDGFLVSNNIEVLEVNTVDDNFRTSYHNPVTMEFRLE